MKEKRILFVLSSHGKLGNTGEPTGWWLSEAAHPWAEFSQNGFKVDFVSPLGGEPPMTGADLNDPVSKSFLDDPEVAKAIKNTLLPENVDPSKYIGILYVGGHGAMWDFPDNKQLQTIASKIYEAGGVVGAVCHGPAGLVNLHLSNGKLLVANKNITCFSNEEEHEVGKEKVVPFLLQDALTEDGGVCHEAPKWHVNVKVDGRLVTGQNPQSAASLGKEMVALINTITKG